jgi:hypothetical protein
MRSLVPTLSTAQPKRKARVAYLTQCLWHDLLILWIGHGDRRILLSAPGVRLRELSQSLHHRARVSRVPLPQGISQTLIIARIGFSRLRSPSSAAKFAARFLASDERVVEEEDRANLVIDITENGDDIESIAVRPLPQSESA